jgi:hypothetical protein
LRYPLRIGNAVWEFRWSEKGPDGKRVYLRRVIGTVDQYSDAEEALHMVAGLVAEVNSGEPRTRSTAMTCLAVRDQ